MSLNGPANEVIPAFTVSSVSAKGRTREITQYVKQKDGPPKRETKTVLVDDGYMVKTPFSGSVFINSKAELDRLHLNTRPAMVHVASGETVPIYAGEQSVGDQVTFLNEDDK